MRAYAGIGSRRTPTPMIAAARPSSRRGWLSGATCSAPATRPAPTRRSSAEPTATPRSTCRGRPSRPRSPAPPATCSRHPSPQAVDMAAAHHPAWERLGRGPRSLHARNCHQILGRDLDAPACFVVCWTPDGATTTPGPSTGGTGQALRIAAAQQHSRLQPRPRPGPRNASRPSSPPGRDRAGALTRARSGQRRIARPRCRPTAAALIGRGRITSRAWCGRARSIPSGANTGGIVSTPDSIALVLALLVILIRELKER